MLSTYLATDLIIRSYRTDLIGPAMRTLTFRLTHASERHSQAILTMFRLTTSTKTKIRGLAKEFVKKYVEEVPVKLEPRDLVIVIADNIQFLVDGQHNKDAGMYKHYTLIMLRIIKEEVLKGIGF
mmetsp:Transcript_6214/g.10296  ORF Transcript_6214/g.10296 Transcript_6214/m.10296 type:complete len:125 (+) Transcript_6214:293-667(+)